MDKAFDSLHKTQSGNQKCQVHSQISSRHNYFIQLQFKFEHKCLCLCRYVRSVFGGISEGLN